MRRSTRTTLLIAASVILIIVVLVVLRAKAPPEVARLLPESDAVVYMDLKPIRAATHYDKTVVIHDATYQKFIDATGFLFERDLNEAAFALQRMPDPTGPNGAVAFSEVFAGHFDRKRLHQLPAIGEREPGNLRQPHHLFHPFGPAHRACRDPELRHGRGFKYTHARADPLHH